MAPKKAVKRRGRKPARIEKRPVTATKDGLAELAKAARAFIDSLVRSMARGMAMLRAVIMLLVAFYRLWLLVRALKGASSNRRDRLVQGLIENLRSLRITTNVDDLDVAIAYAQSVLPIVGRSSCPLTVSIVIAAQGFEDVLMAIRGDVLYARGVIHP